MPKYTGKLVVTETYENYVVEADDARSAEQELRKLNDHNTIPTHRQSTVSDVRRVGE